MDVFEPLAFPLSTAAVDAFPSNLSTLPIDAVPIDLEADTAYSADTGFCVVA